MRELGADLPAQPAGEVLAVLDLVDHSGVVAVAGVGDAGEHDGVLGLDLRQADSVSRKRRLPSARVRAIEDRRHQPVRIDLGDPGLAGAGQRRLPFDERERSPPGRVVTARRTLRNKLAQNMTHRTCAERCNDVVDGYALQQSTSPLNVGARAGRVGGRSPRRWTVDPVRPHDNDPQGPAEPAIPLTGRSCGTTHCSVTAVYLGDGEMKHPSPAHPPQGQFWSGASSSARIEPNRGGPSPPARSARSPRTISLRTPHLEYPWSPRLGELRVKASTPTVGSWPRGCPSHGDAVWTGASGAYHGERGPF